MDRETARMEKYNSAQHNRRRKRRPEYPPARKNPKRDNYFHNAKRMKKPQLIPGGHIKQEVREVADPRVRIKKRRKRRIEKSERESNPKRHLRVAFLHGLRRYYHRAKIRGARMIVIIPRARFSKGIGPRLTRFHNMTLIKGISERRPA